MANFTKYLIHCDGTDASTTFDDVSIYNHTVTANGNAQVDTADKKFGTGSLLLDGSGDYLSSAGSSQFIFGTGAFTFDFWIKLNSGATGDNTIFTTGGSAGTGVFLEYSVTTTLLQARINGVDEIVGTSAVSLNAWHHVAFVRSGSTLYCFLDGVEQGAGQTNSADISSNALGLWIGQEDAARWFFNGWIDEFRVSNVARWTTDFTPPSAAYDDPSSTSSSSSSSSCRSSSSSSSSCRSSSSSSSCRSSSSSSCSSSSSSSCRSSSSSSSSCRSSSSSSSCRSSSSSSSCRSSSSSSSSSISSSSSSSSCRSSSSSSSCSSSSSSSRSSSSSSSSRSSSSSSSSCSSSCSSSSSSSNSSSSSSSSCRSSSSSSKSSSCSSSSYSHAIFRIQGLDKISKTATYYADEPDSYVNDVDTDLTNIFDEVNRGFKPSRFTTSQRDSLTELFPGLIIVNVSTNKLNWYTGVSWEAITSA